MDIGKFSFGSVRIDGTLYEHDVIIDRGTVSRRKKKASKEFRSLYGHTPLSLREEIPWKCKRLIVGTGAHGSLPVMEEIEHEAKERDVELIVLPTADAIEQLKKTRKSTNAILHVTC